MTNARVIEMQPVMTALWSMIVILFVLVLGDGLARVM